ncbi:MAG TPA: TAT-variant-translocated molybdopterin oxidoreductase [Tepidisphaeraceae bacterium]|nr:TAT-variant-translocated molybdopterin oxidoreductase [Tepidisphaeraceae bacterium]
MEDRELSIESRGEKPHCSDRSPIPESLSAPRLWRSLDELAQTDEFREAMFREFPKAASEWDDSTSRRSFLKVMGASIALAGMAGCVRPTTEKIVPYIRQPEEMTPGKPLYFATASTFRGYARGILVESHEGRPTKIEGNPDHPASLGAADAITQGHVLDLYDPDRSQVVNYAGEVSNWNSFSRVIQAEFESRKNTGGQGIRLLTGTITSPTLAAQIDALIKTYPNLKWHQFEPVNKDNEKQGLQQAFGKIVQPIYHFDRAKIIVSLDDNFLADHPGSVRYARNFADGRRMRPKQDKKDMSRLYVAESSPSITGAVADERVRAKPSEILNIARGIESGNGTGEFVQHVVADLAKFPGETLIVAGESQPPEVHALAAALNSKLGNIGKAVEYVDSVEANPQIQTESLRQLIADMASGGVDVLIMIGGNPAYDAPTDFGFAEKLRTFSTTNGKRTIHLSSHYDETSFLCQWHLPLAHELEAWGDARAFDGTATIIQPLIAPLYQGRSPYELLTILLGAPNRGGYEIIRDYWAAVLPGNDFESRWDKWLNDGVIPDTQAKAVSVSLTADATKQTAQSISSGTEIIFRPDPQLWDGRYANNGWLMEVARPLTRLTWDNVALMSPKTAEMLGLIAPADYLSKPKATIVTLAINNQSVRAPIWLMPGHPDDCITVHLGFGRDRSGRVGGTQEFQPGFNAYTLRSSSAMWFASGLKVSSTGDEMVLACIQNHSSMNQEGRDLIHIRKLNGETKSEEKRTVSLTLYPPRPYHDDVRQGNKWGMVIDQNACIGCNACVVACQSENNIAVVGKEQVSRGREMQWLRIDTYYAGKSADDADGPYFQPMLCMHCENAPCEVVCPVGATTHDAEGLNNMVYNRCVGTRYCSNNCPYKVRHFNFFQFSNTDVEVLKMAANPNVTVRTRGVMEKCSYCVQRINATRIEAKKQFVNGQREFDAIHDGEVVTACQQSCPTQAIYFGNINDKDLSRDGKGSVVRELLEEEGNYTLLDEELQTRPRTSYLPRYINPA